MYLTLFLTDSLPDSQVIAVLFGLLAYSISLANIYMASRPRYLEKIIGFHSIYTTHAMMAFVLVGAAIVHAILEGFDFTFDEFPGLTSLLGLLGLIFFILITLTGVFFLSEIITSKIKNRYFGLWLHRITVVSVILIYIHIMMVGFANSNPLFVVLLTLYTVLAFASLIFEKVNPKKNVPYELVENRKLADMVNTLVFAPTGDRKLSFDPAQFAFIKMTDSSLSKEKHPFTITSTTDDNNIQFMIKDSGDYTSQLDKLKVGDKAILEGAYGDLIEPQNVNDSKSLVLIAGGIGITPMIGILRNLKNKDKKVKLIWSARNESDLIKLEEIEELKNQYPNFDYRITLSKDDHETFDKGRIDEDYLNSLNVFNEFKDAKFYICGPDPLMDSMEDILSKHIDKDQQNYERFKIK